VRDYDRISRDDREGPSFVYALQDAGAEVWEYTTRSPIKVERAMDRTLLNMKAGFAAHEAEASSSRTREKKFEKAARGAIADGRVLGYRTVGDLNSRRREIDPEQAEIVRRIFQMAADGAGLPRIARRLNEAGVVNPTGQVRTGKGAKSVASAWSTGGIREILRRELYVGSIVYGRTRNAGRRTTG
jgi:site-specific DNA recombinase